MKSKSTASTKHSESDRHAKEIESEEEIASEGDDDKQKVKGSLRKSTKEKLAEYLERKPELTESDGEKIYTALAERAYHLPGNGWCEDYVQFFANNHPIFGICFHHPLNPVGNGMRVVNLIGSVVVGLAITNIIWCFMINDRDNVALNISVSGLTNNATALVGIDGNSTALSQLQETKDIIVTKGMLVLWTVGAGLHSIFDNTIWSLSACGCCLPGHSLHFLERYSWCGSYLVVMIVILLTAIATLAVVLRATIDNTDSAIDISNTQNLTEAQALEVLENAKGLQLNAFDFLKSYAIELGLALLVYFPMTATIMFSGCLGCGLLKPFLGGRPYEVELEQKEKEKQEEEEQQASKIAASPSTDDEWNDEKSDRSGSGPGSV